MYTSNLLLHCKYEVYFNYTFGDILTSKVCKFMTIIETCLDLYVSSIESIKNLVMKYTSNIL